MTDFKLLIDGVEREGAEGIWEPVFDPASDETIGRVAFASEQDLDLALSVSQNGLRIWSETTPWVRGEILKKAADLLRNRSAGIARKLTLEQGKPLSEALAEVQRSADFLEWGGEQARRISDRIVPARESGNKILVETCPVGVVAAFTPWNFPMALAAKKFAGALGAGCSIICKPDHETPSPVLALAQACLDAGVPPSAVGVVFGVPSQVSSKLISAQAVSKITFTGSIPVGKLLAAEAGKVMKPVTMELGGHAPVIICSDVDPEAVAEYLVPKKFANAGQICMSPTRFFVEGDNHERFSRRFAAVASEIVVGHGLDAGTQMGPLANTRRIDAIEKLVEDARQNGAELMTGGSRLGNGGNYFAPTVLSHVPPHARMMREEPFGPVAPINRFDDENEMLDQANGLEFGLSAYVFTKDPARAQQLKSALAFGTIGINDIPTHLPDVPLGGWKESGYGVEGGIEILQPYQKSKFVSER